MNNYDQKFKPHSSIAIKSYLTAELISIVLGKNIDHQDNSGILLDCGELNFFNLDGEKGSQGESMPLSIFLNTLQTYCSQRGYDIDVFGCANSHEPNDNIYDATVKHGFGNELYKTEESCSRDEVILECFDWILKNTNVKELVLACSNMSAINSSIKHADTIEVCRLLYS